MKFTSLLAPLLARSARAPAGVLRTYQGVSKHWTWASSQATLSSVVETFGQRRVK
ncbi:hypothetical protein IMZ48_32470 [Candidatus Bathyarchaeota archaeon]|nr:hypothetical protein [Candidatus Bathyarchaeota archaeon]